MGLTLLIAILAIAALLAWILYHLARRAVAAAEKRAQALTASMFVDSAVAEAEFVHALRALSKRTWFRAYICGAFLAGFAAAVAVRWSSLESGGRIGAGAVLVVAWAMPTVLAPRPVAAAYARARGIPPAQLRSRRTTAVRVTFLAMWLWPLPVALAVASTATTRILFTAVAYLLAVPLAMGLLAPAIARLLAPDLVAPELSARLAALASTARIRVGTTRVMPSRARKLANAAQVGWLPGLQSVVITDYLLDSLTEADVDAVFAHELGHARGHDAVKRSVLCGLVFFCSTSSVIGAVSHTNPVFALGGLAVGLVVIRLQRGWAVRQEIAADDFAAQLVGPGHLAGALDRLSHVNALKRDTSAKWDRQVGHPGMAIRIARLEAQELASRPDAVPGVVS